MKAVGYGCMRLWLIPLVLVSGAARAFEIQGVVRDEAGEGVAGATVWYVRGMAVHRKETDASGHVVFGHGEVGPFALIARKPGLALDGLSGMISGPQSFSLTLRTSGEVVLCAVDPLQFEGGGYKRVAGARLEQMIVDARFNVPLALLTEHGFPPLRSGDDGLIRIPCLPHGGHVAVRVSHRAYADAFVPFALVDADDEFLVQLAPGAPVRGRVTGPGGAGVADAVVSVYRTMEQGIDTYKEAVTGPDGFYTGMAPFGKYLVGVTCPGFVPPDPVVVTISAETDEVIADLSLAPAGFVTGQVRGPDGDPVGGVFVGCFRDDDLYMETVSADSDGMFRLEAPPGPGRIHVLPPEGLRAQFPEGIQVTAVEAEELPLPNPVALVPLGTFAGRALTPDGAPAAEVLIVADNVQPVCRAVTDASGAFSLSPRNAPFGPALSIRAEHARRFWRGAVEVPVTQSDPITIALESFEPDLRPSRSDEDESPFEVLLDKPAPALECAEWVNASTDEPAPALDGTLKGKVVVLTFWDKNDAAGIAADWLEEVSALYAAYRDVDDVAFVGIASGATDREGLDALAQSFNVRWPVGRDAEGVPTFDAYDVNYVPQTFLIDKRGVLRYYDVAGRLLELIKALRREA